MCKGIDYNILFAYNNLERFFLNMDVSITGIDRLYEVFDENKDN